MNGIDFSTFLNSFAPVFAIGLAIKLQRLRRLVGAKLVTLFYDMIKIILIISDDVTAATIFDFFQ